MTENAAMVEFMFSAVDVIILTAEEDSWERGRPARIFAMQSHSPRLAGGHAIECFQPDAAGAIPIAA